MNKKVAQALCDANVVKFGEFKLASGDISPVYIDLRILPSFPGPFNTVMDEFVQMIKSMDIDVVAGIETAGIPISTAVAVKAQLPMVYVRRRPKGYGTNSMIEGVLEKGQKVVLIDDLITNGGSKMKFVSGIPPTGAVVNDVAVILDRDQGGKEMLQQENIELHSLITLKELLDYMREHSIISKIDYKKVTDYLKKNAENN